MEKRRHSRVAVHLPISFSGDEAAGEGLVSSISKDGCAVVSPEKIEPGALLDLRIKFPEHDALMEVDLAVVRWVHGGRFGLEFIRMHPDEQERLQRVFSALEPQPLRA